MAMLKLFNINNRICANPLFMKKTAVPSFKVGSSIHFSLPNQFPQAAALKLPTNVVDINAAEMGQFSPLRARDYSGKFITSQNLTEQDSMAKIDITVQSDAHVNSYDCRGAVSLSSSMQSNVPSPFCGNHTHLGMPGSQWGQGYKYLSDHLHSSHYLTLRNEYRGIHSSARKSVAFRPPERNMSSSTEQNVKLSSREKLKRAVNQYGSTVIVFHVTISLISLGTSYLLVSSGLDVTAILDYFKISSTTIRSAAESNAGTFVVAYAFHKIFAPARMLITLTATPFLVRHLRKIGILKHPPTNIK